MFFRILRQSFFEGRKRKILAAATVALAATLITALLDLSVDVGDKMAREMKSYGANIRVVPKSETVALEVGGIDYNPLKGRDYLDESDLPLIKDIFWRNNIVGLAPFLRTVGGGRGQDGAGHPPDWHLLRQKPAFARRRHLPHRGDGHQRLLDDRRRLAR